MAVPRMRAADPVPRASAPQPAVGSQIQRLLSVARTLPSSPPALPASSFPATSLPMSSVRSVFRTLGASPPSSGTSLIASTPSALISSAPPFQIQSAPSFQIQSAPPFQIQSAPHSAAPPTPRCTAAPRSTAPPPPRPTAPPPLLSPGISDASRLATLQRLMFATPGGVSQAVTTSATASHQVSQAADTLRAVEMIDLTSSPAAGSGAGTPAAEGLKRAALNLECLLSFQVARPPRSSPAPHTPTPVSHTPYFHPLLASAISKKQAGCTQTESRDTATPTMPSAGQPRDPSGPQHRDPQTPTLADGQRQASSGFTRTTLAHPCVTPPLLDQE